MAEDAHRPPDRDDTLSELYFLVAKLLAGGPLSSLAQELRRGIQRAQILPARKDWQGRDHPQTFEEFESQYENVSSEHLLSVCKAILQNKSSLEPKRSLLDCSLFRKRVPKIQNNVLQRILSRQSGLQKKCVLPEAYSGSMQLQRRTLGHLNSVYCVLFDRTGRFIITGADDFLIKVWSTVDGRLIMTLRGPAAEITDMTVDMDNNLLAAGSLDKLVRVWDLQTAAPIAVLQGHSGMITSVHFCPAKSENLSYLVSTSTDGSVAFWIYQCGKKSFMSKPNQFVERMRPGACQMICCAWSPGGLFLASGSADHHVRVYMMQDSGPKRILEIAAHCEAVDSLQWAHSGLRFVSGSKDGTAILWHFHSMQWKHIKLNMSQTLPGQPAPADDGKKTKVTMVAWNSTDSYVITAVNDYSLKVWCSQTGKLVRILHGHSDEVYVLEAHPYHCSVILSAGHDGNIFIWDILKGESLGSFANHIEGQGNGAVFDAKWSPDGSKIAATDSHGHILILGLGKGHKLLSTLPSELFFHTDYRPLTRDGQGTVTDEQTGVPPHLMSPPFLVDVEGAPYPPSLQRLVPGRENATMEQLVPDTGNVPVRDGDFPRSQIDYMIEALALRQVLNDLNEEDGVYELDLGPPLRNEGVRNSVGEWQRGNPLLITTKSLVDNLSSAEINTKRLYIEEMTQFEMDWYTREMRRRPMMISTIGWNGETGPPKKSRKPRPPRRPRSQNEQENERQIETISMSSESESSDKLSDSDSEVSISIPSNDDSSCSSSDYSDWVADRPGVPLQPPKRAKRKPAPKPKYPNRNARKNVVTSTSPAAVDEQTETPIASTSSASAVIPDIPEPYRPSEWLCAVQPRKAPYHPQMGDECMYFKQGHQRYLDAVTDKAIYKVSPRDIPWERSKLKDCESVKVVGIKYVLRPPRLVCLKLMMDNGSHFTVRYHDMPDVLDFLVLRQSFDQANSRGWAIGDRFRSMIDDSWWLGTIVEDNRGKKNDLGSQFLSLKVRWDNGEFEQMSPWDLEQIDDERLPDEEGGSISVLAHELETLLYRPRPEEWPEGNRRNACEMISKGIDQVMSLAIAEPFLAPVDLNIYPSYTYIVEYPIDLSTIKARFENHFYRRMTSAQFDVRYLATNAEKFNQPGSPIIKQARVITDLCLQVILNPFTIDVAAVYRSLIDNYKSSDSDVPISKQRSYKSSIRTRGRNWVARCRSVLNGVWNASESQPFREPVSMESLPEYGQVVARPMDLSTVRQRLDSGIYHDPSQFAADMRLIFANSKLYNTNRRSRAPNGIYSMTLRLEELFEAQFAPIMKTTRSLRKRIRNDSSSETSNRKFNGINNGKHHSSSDDDDDDDRFNGTSNPSSSRTNVGFTLRPRLNGHHVESSDSDVPLKSYKGKGKGIGKKSTVESPPTRSSKKTTNGFRDDDDDDDAEIDIGEEEDEEEEEEEDIEEEEHQSDNGLKSESEVDSDNSSDSSNSSESEDSYKPSKEKSSRTHSNGSHKRKKSVKQSKSRPPKRRKHSKKRAKAKKKQRSSMEKTDSSSDSERLSVVSGASGRRYESDHSFQLKPESQSDSDDDDDDDTPLGHMARNKETTTSRLRTRTSHPDDARPGPSGIRVRRTVRDAARQPRRYNEDSEDDEDNIATISKRVRRHQHLPRLGIRRVAHTNNLNISIGARPVAGPSHRGQSDDSSAEDNQPLSVSSRGRIRKLTAKGRELFRD